MTGRRAAVLLLVLWGACGKKEPGPPAGALETEQYLAWKGSQAIRQLASGSAETASGTVRVHYPEGRSKGPDDFIELRLNGLLVQQTRWKPAGGGMMGPFGVHVTLMAGPNTFDLWDSTTNSFFRFQVDTRQGTDYVFTPDAAGYVLTWSKREN